MCGKIKVEINGNKLELPEGTVLEDAIRVSNAPYRKGTAIGIIIDKAGEEIADVSRYIVRTSKGEFRIELKDGTSHSKGKWLSSYTAYKDMPVRWTSKDAVAFGPFPSDTVPLRGSADHKGFELMFAAGSDPTNTHLIFTKARHPAEYGAPEEGTFASIISGKHVLSDLSRGDRILEIVPVTGTEDAGEHLCTTDLRTVLVDGSRIFTYLEMEIDPEAPEGAEHLFAVTRDGTFLIDAVASSYISDHRFLGELVTYENFESRSAGSVFVRTVGYGAGKLFIATEDRTSTIMHSVVGHVIKGLELAKLAKEGQRIMIESSPEPIMLIGRNFIDAEAEMELLGVDVIREDYTGDDGFIVMQTPATTIGILAEKRVTLKGVDPDHLVNVRFYNDLVPKTMDFFRHATGMQYKPVGALMVLMTYDDTFIFKAMDKEADKYKELMPENIPEKKVLSGEIGVTNQAAKRSGMIGVKLLDNDLFGPTGEKFNCTNIIGKVIDTDKLRKFKDGDIMYIIESEGEET